jgi:hypothetical protein
MSNLVVMILANAQVSFDNMNGAYLTTPTPHAPKDMQFNTKWDEYPGDVEYFEAYMGPITSLYSQVW